MIALKIAVVGRAQSSSKADAANESAIFASTRGCARQQKQEGQRENVPQQPGSSQNPKGCVICNLMSL